MPPKAKKNNATAPAQLVDPLAAECLAAIKEERSATAELAQMDEDEPGVEEQTAKAAGNYLAEVGTNDFGFQLGRPWAPSVKDNEEGQKQRVREPVESVVNDDEPPEDVFEPYPTEPKINQYLLEDGTILFVDVRTGRAVADEAGNSIEVQFKKEEDSDQEMMEDGEEHSGGETDSEAHGHDDSDNDPDDDAHGDDE
ncbi:hypothetical protein ACET3X_002127 [Alternaria dauci]|uniref:Uncharacterized protein n=1 Tax=Alternaria dauci TaxID=48095 RepID=A0ABR3UNM2_9PLEO